MILLGHVKIFAEAKQDTLVFNSTQYLKNKSHKNSNGDDSII